MKNLNEIKERFLQEEPKMRLGHLASSLSRVCFFSEKGLLKPAKEIMEEIKYMIEWTAADVSPDMQAVLSEIQSRIAFSDLIWKQLTRNRKVLKNTTEQAKIWSNELLKKAGLLQ